MLARGMTAVLLVLPLAGCATVPHEAGFGDVQKQVSTRINQPVQWRGRTADDAAVDQAVERLLASPLTVETAVQVALLNNLHLQAMYQDLGMAQADLVQAGLLRNPVFNIERRFPGQALDIGVTASFLDLFSVGLRKKVAASEFEAAKSRVANAVLQTAWDVRSAYFTYQADEQLLAMRQMVVQAAQAAAEMAARMHQAGNINELDLAEQQSMAEQAQIELSGAQGRATQDREHLNQLMGVWGARLKWSIVKHVADLPAADPAATELEGMAIVRRLDLAAARQDIQTAARSLGYTRTFRFIPDLGVGARYVHEIEPEHSLGPSLALQIPIFDQGQAQVSRDEALLRQKQFEYLALAADVRSQVRAAYARMEVARDQAERYRDVLLPLEAKIVQRSQLQYNGMFIGVFKLLQAKRSQIKTQQKYVEQLRDYWIARSDLEHAVGGRLAAQRPATQPASPPPPAEGERQTHDPVHHH